MCTAQTSRAACPKANYPSTDDGLGAGRACQPQPIPHVGRGLLHFNDQLERDRYAAYCHSQLEQALARWERDSNFMDVGEADFWVLELRQLATPERG